MSDFIKNQKASITIEMTAVFSLFVMLIILVANVSSSVTTQIKLDSLSYQLASLLRERNTLYKDDNLGLSAENVEQIYKIAQVLTEDNLKAELGITVKYLHFDDDNNTEIFSFNEGKMECDERDLLEDIDKIAFKNSFGKMTDLYLFTICAKSDSGFVKKLSDKVFTPLSTAVVFAR